MTSVRETILAEVASRLETAATAAGAGFARNRLAEVEAPDFWIMYDDGFAVAEGDTGGLRRVQSVTVAAYVGAATDAALGPAISTAEAAIEVAIRPEDDETLGGLAGVEWVELVEMLDPVFSTDQDARPFAVFEVKFQVTFATDWHDPTVAA